MMPGQPDINRPDKDAIVLADEKGLACARNTPVKKELR
jgi:hypothetical protein